VFYESDVLGRALGVAHPCCSGVRARPRAQMRDLRHAVPLLRKLPDQDGGCVALGRFAGGDQGARGALRFVEGFLEGRLRADSCGFADALCFLLLHGLPRREDYLFAGDFVEVAFDAFLILSGDALEF
jgi:hypothetical protein